MWISWMWANVCLVLVSVSANGQSLDRIVREYQAPKWIDWNLLADLDHQFSASWGKTPPGRLSATSALNEINHHVEPEAIAALLRVLRDGESEVFYGTYDSEVPNAEIGKDYEPHTRDGLVGLRLIRQTKSKGLLISSLQSYVRRGAKLYPRSGSDSLRIRIQVGPFSPRAPRVVGFSWTTEVNASGGLTRIHSEPYLTEDPKVRYGEIHPALAKPDVTPCGLATHCNLCHHRDRLNTFSKAYRSSDPAETPGFRDLIEELEMDSNVSTAEAKALKTRMLDPRTSFPSEDLERALIERWNEIHALR